MIVGPAYLNIRPFTHLLLFLLVLIIIIVTTTTGFNFHFDVALDHPYWYDIVPQQGKGPAAQSVGDYNNVMVRYRQVSCTPWNVTAPTQAPTTSAKPTTVPTPAPTTTKAPTAPTTQPSKQPTSPTTQPSKQPTSPTLIPTSSPSVVPTTVNSNMITEAQFNQIVNPNRICEVGSDGAAAIAFYTYANLVAAFNKYPFPTYPPISSALEWAAFFGQTAHESGNFCYINEFGAQSLAYCVDTPDYPCVPGAKYFGRGPIQLSYNYNYGPFSEAWFNGNKSVLLYNPDLVGQNGVTGWGSGLWFWATQVGR